MTRSSETLLGIPRATWVAWLVVILAAVGSAGYALANLHGTQADQGRRIERLEAGHAELDRVTRRIERAAARVETVLGTSPRHTPGE